VSGYDGRWGEGYQQDCEEFLHSLLTALQVQPGGYEKAPAASCRACSQRVVLCLALVCLDALPLQQAA
jgi:hypothetical protein